jgi:hypothetical protein
VADELWDKMVKFPGGGHVGYYFYNAFMDIWTKGMKDDFLILKNAFPTAELWVREKSPFLNIQKFRLLGTHWEQLWQVFVPVTSLPCNFFRPKKSNW